MSEHYKPVDLYLCITYLIISKRVLNQLESPELGIDKIVKMMTGLPFLWALIVYTDRPNISIMSYNFCMCQ